MNKSVLATAASTGVFAFMLASAPAQAKSNSKAADNNAATGSATSQAQPTAAPDTASSDAASQDTRATKEIVVTGFRGSLTKSIQLKRQSIGLRDSIVAEDIGKFPEANVADSLQRIPGVILSRDGGAGSNEGQQVAIRGLGPEFVVTTLNGAPVRTTSDGSIGGSSRAFNYDVFPSEFFGRVDVYKSPLASLEEGGIGGNIDLQTPRPFDNSGRAIRYTAQMNYNTQSNKWRPRGSLILSDTWGNFGALFGVAYAENVNDRSGFQSTGGYNTSALGSRPFHGTVPGNTSGPFQFELNLNSPLANFGNLTSTQIANAYLPRFYRVYASTDNRTRLGFVGSLQYQSDRFEASLDGIYSKLTDEMDEFTFGVPVRSTRTVAGSTSTPGTGTNSGIIPLDVHIDQYNNLYGTFGNTSILTESFFRNFQTKFKYGIARAAYHITGRMTLSTQGSISDSDAWQSGNRIVSNIYGITTTYDPTVDINYPTITSPVDFTNPANFKDPSLNFSLQREIDKVKSARAVLDWNPIDTGEMLLSFKVGGSYVASTKRRSQQDGSAIARALLLPGGGTFASNPTGVFKYMDPFVQNGALANGGNSGYPSEFATFPRSFVMDVLAANQSNRQAPVQLNSAYKAEEDVKSVFAEASFKVPIAGHQFRGDIGVRYSDTKTLINNYTNVGGMFTPAVRNGGYRNFLPSGTLAFDVTRKLVWRAAAGRTITRAALNDIAGGIVVPNVFNNAITVGNPNLRPQIANTYDTDLEWYFAPGGLVSVGVFKKDIFDRPTAVVQEIPFSEAGLPASAFSCAAWGGPTNTCSDAALAALTPNPTIFRTIVVNQQQLKLRGLELAYQQNFTFLPTPFNGLGVTSSFTAINQTQKGFDFILTNGHHVTLQAVPKYTYSITAFYEKGPLSIRGSYNYRAKTPFAPQTNTGNDEIGYFAAQGYLDATVAYKINRFVELRVDALNITNENTFTYFENPEKPNGLTHRDNSYFNGRTISLGVRGRF
ncbi:MAG TPA: TonB-dependent receptor [Sphingomicrobium sp.]|nr:TonB-dependent receptor [Sphingomicrobium sp.]